MSELRGARIHITGIVQGVGFRPFVYGLAARYGLRGWVANTSAGVDIEVDGPLETLERFVSDLAAQAPPLSHIDSIAAIDTAPNGFTEFLIRDSVARAGDFQPISPDIAICDDCLREMRDPGDRRYRYPFINCTNCGPRFTLIKDIPYDRPLTTMAAFAMCPDCAAEYADPLDRRFHAQPVACPKCGPKVWLVMRDQVLGIRNWQSPIPNPQSPIEEAKRLLANGKIVAIKGLGGFHLACDATNDEAVAELRRRKGRVDKPFALMAASLESIEQFCEVTVEERTLLESRQRPIVLLNRRAGPASGQAVSPHVAPGQFSLGFMLPYTPLHYLLFDNSLQPSSPALATQRRGVIPHPLVMTSGNLSEEPIATDNDEALARLSRLADAFLLHDRDIHVRCDDSVVRVFERRELPIRRSRGYAPYPVKLPFETPPALAAGAELKNTFCITRGAYAFLSHHIGDMENYETLRSFEDGVAHFERLFRIRLELIAYDLHPNYLATRYALQRAERDGLRAIGVQHHHAHIAACMAENGLRGDRPVIGVAFDGTGYGSDGAIWGGEFLIASYAGFERAAHLAYVPLPGGDAAIRHPYRTALSHLRQAGVEWSEDLAPVKASQPTERLALAKQIESGLNAPPTSSLGRLFDAVASIVNVRQSVNYEGQAAIEFETMADKLEVGSWRLEVGSWTARKAGVDCPQSGRGRAADGSRIVETAPLIRSVVDEVRAGVPASIISARFHNALAVMVRDVCS
ncbi:MAG TPA: carbamoyltransferase HypF, partial [Anaerolineae bacterium]|nr:carbamoyltransferase HypF [Anaerolineae bacterium]